ncbi:hypothetical protein MOQ72_27240 [Saccharopolyspora sp. K220]|uniref:hypothetical protein n=1 Tax=Saccharopolyspora soli TaxID=2926618 RepID=UPI001F5AD93F|nr:hypothetical protein [Saccharopolyspora soli]MCI2421144.1 hypothetical protein [Saccharopolyspora soli]
MPTNVHLLTGAVTASVTAPDLVSSSVLDRIARSTGPMLPGGWHPSPPGATDPEIRIVLIRTVGTPSISLSDTNTVVLHLREEELTGDALAYITYTVAERARQRRGMVTVHATAATSPAGHTVLLVGDKGAGKTTTLLALVDRGWRPLGDDLLILTTSNDAPYVVAGKRTSAVRQPGGARHGYETKALYDLGPHDPAKPELITAVVRLSIHPGTLPTTSIKPVRLSLVERLRLAENFGRYISGLPTPLALAPEVCAQVYPLDHADAAAARTALIAAINTLGLSYLQAPYAHTSADLIEELITP